MENRIRKSVIGGIMATAAMTAFMYIAPNFGLPEMNAAEMLSQMAGFMVEFGWIMHFVIGVFFAIIYGTCFIDLLAKVENNLLKGAIFGLAVFVFAQIAIAGLGAVTGEMPSMSGNMVLITIGSILNHVVYGVVLALFVKAPAGK
jgi:uncharacterized membrane protein YagU involved in acid resistance